VQWLYHRLTGKLMADSAAAQSLRAIIIEREPARFLAGLGNM
jgi:hypothetical protein